MLVFVVFVLFLVIGGYFAFRYVEKIPPPRRIAGTPSYNFENSAELYPDVNRNDKHKKKLSQRDGEKKTMNNYAIWEDDPPLYLNIKKPHIHFLMKDPDWLFCYWHWGQEGASDFNQQYGENAWNNSIPVIRYLEPGTGYVQDFVINDYANTWYFKVHRRNVHVTMHLGRILNGRFIHLATSNTFKVPRGTVSPNIDPNWAPLPGLAAGVSGEGLPGGASSAEFITTDR